MTNKTIMLIIILLSIGLVSGCQYRLANSENIISDKPVTSISAKAQELFDYGFSDYLDIPIITSDGYELKTGIISLPISNGEFVPIGALDGDSLIVLCGNNLSNLAIYSISKESLDILVTAEPHKSLAVQGYNDKYICYITYSPYAEISQYTWNYVDLSNKNSKAFFSSDDTIWTVKDSAIINEKIYFHQVEDTCENGVNTYKLYEYDTKTNSTKVICENGCYPQKYHNKLAFIKDNAKLVLYEESATELLLDLNESNLYQNSFGINISGNVVTYSYQIEDETDPEIAVGSGVGYIDENKRIDLIEGKNVSNWLEHLRFGNMGYAVWNCVGDSTLPVFYDMNAKVFVVISEELAHYQTFATNDAIVFVSDEQSGKMRYYVVK